MPMLSKLQLTRHQVAIAGEVTDAETGRAVARARVEITAAPAAFTGRLAIQAMACGEHWAAMDERPDRSLTAADGHFHFIDLPDGDYVLTASLPGAGTRYDKKQQGPVNVSRDAVGNIKMVKIDLALPPTALAGQITDQAAGVPILLAEVRIKGSGERGFSNSQGQYLITSLEAGKCTVLVSARGYKTAAQIKELHQGKTETLDVALEI